MTINILTTVLLNLAILIGLFGFLTLIFKGISFIFYLYSDKNDQTTSIPSGTPAEEPI